MAEAETRTAEAPRIRVSVLTSGEEVIECWRKKSLKIHLNQNKKFKGNLGVLLIFLESLDWVRFNEGVLGIFRFKV
jgi:hypothetical protein